MKNSEGGDLNVHFLEESLRTYEYRETHEQKAQYRKRTLSITYYIRRIERKETGETVGLKL